MYIIVGLGNPSREYIATRHNIGFDAITCICDKYDISLDYKKCRAICGKGRIAGEKVLVAMPQTYMNLSGESVRGLVDYFKINPKKELVVIYDDTDLDVGRLRIRAEGSAGGHNGIKNIISHLGTQEFQRIRIGIGGKPPGWDLADYVLRRFEKNEQKMIRDALKDTADVAEVIISEGIDSAMNQYNRNK